VFFGDTFRGKGMSGTVGRITFAKTWIHTVGPFGGQLGSD
jgi:hypothetical protein